MTTSCLWTALNSLACELPILSRAAVSHSLRQVWCFSLSRPAVIDIALYSSQLSCKCMGWKMILHR